MKSNSQTFDQIKSRCSRCGIIPHYTYTCSECNKYVCESCYPHHKNECSLINHQHNKSNHQYTKSSTKENSAYQYQCSYCNKRELQRIVCPDCHKQFCIEHRKQFSHKCQKNIQVQHTLHSQNTMKEKEQQIVPSSQSKPSNETKKSNFQTKQTISVNEKLQRYKKQNELLKNAKGRENIPLNQRYYLEMMLPNETTEMIYLNKTQTFKDSLLWICMKCKLNVTGGHGEVAKRYSLMDEEGNIIDYSKRIDSIRNYSIVIVLEN